MKKLRIVLNSDFDIKGIPSSPPPREIPPAGAGSPSTSPPTTK